MIDISVFIPDNNHADFSTHNAELGRMVSTWLHWHRATLVLNYVSIAETLSLVYYIHASSREPYRSFLKP